MTDKYFLFWYGPRAQSVSHHCPTRNDTDIRDMLTSILHVRRSPLPFLHVRPSSYGCTSTNAGFGFDHRPVHVGFVIQKLALVQVLWSYPVCFNSPILHQSVERLATGWTVRGSNPDGGDVFRTRPDRLWGPSSFLCDGYRVFPGGEAAGAWRWPPTPISRRVKERVQLYLYSPSGPSWPVLEWTLPYLFIHLSSMLYSLNVPTDSVITQYT